MEDAPKNPTVDATKGPNTESNAASGPDAGLGTSSDAAPGVDKHPPEGTNQGATKEPAASSAKDAGPNSTSETGEMAPGPAKADGNERLDPKMQKLVEAIVDARLKSLLETQLEPLLAANRQLALFLGGQLENMIELRQSVRAMERLLEGDTRRKSKYAAMLEKVKGEGDGMKDPHWINRTRGMLSRLERTGKLDQPRDDGQA